MRFDKNGVDIMFPSFECIRSDCDKIMNKDKNAPDHFKSTGNFRYRCPKNHVRWISLKEIKHYAI